MTLSEQLIQLQYRKTKMAKSVSRLDMLKKTHASEVGDEIISPGEPKICETRGLRLPLREYWFLEMVTRVLGVH